MGSRLKLGAILVDARTVTPEELTFALGVQAMHGGRIGTNLINLGFLEVNQLAASLSTQLGVLPVRVNELLDADARPLRLLSGEICERYQVFPFAAEQGALYLAMVDPLDVAARQEVALLTGLRVVPHVVPEILLAQALEKRYGIPRSSRFLLSSPPATSQTVEPSTPQRTRAISEILPLVDDTGTPVQQPRRELARVWLVQQRATRESPELDEDSGFYELEATGRWTPPTTGIADPEGVAVALRRSNDHKAVHSHLVHCHGAGGSAVLFVVRGDLAVAAAASTTEASDEEIECLALPLGVDSFLRQALSARLAVRGEALADPLQSVIARHLGWPDAGEVCVAPILCDDRVVNLLCLHAHAPTTLAPTLLDELGHVCDEAGAAYARLVRQHIEVTSSKPVVLVPSGEFATPPRPTLRPPHVVTGFAAQRGDVQIWRALDSSTQRVVAVYVMPKVDEGEATRLARLAHVLRGFSHPHVEAVLGHGTTSDGQPYIIGEWVGDHDLRRLLDADPVPHRERTASILLQMCSALFAAHGRGLVHGRISPQAIAVVEPQRDLCKLAGFAVPVTAAPCYRAPELSGGVATAAADVYALGALTLVMLSGQEPEEGDLRPHVAQLPSLSVNARELLDACLDPVDRVRPSVREFGRDLVSVLEMPAMRRAPS